jgi:hypothetical protein
MCLGRVSAPAVQIILSDLLGVIGLVGRYPTNYLVPTQLISLRWTLLQASIFRYQAFARGFFLSERQITVFFLPRTLRD